MEFFIQNWARLSRATDLCKNSIHVDLQFEKSMLSMCNSVPRTSSLEIVSVCFLSCAVMCDFVVVSQVMIRNWIFKFISRYLLSLGFVFSSGCTFHKCGHYDFLNALSLPQEETFPNMSENEILCVAIGRRRGEKIKMIFADRKNAVHMYIQDERM